MLMPAMPDDVVVTSRALSCSKSRSDEIETSKTNDMKCGNREREQAHQQALKSPTLLLELSLVSSSRKRLHASNLLNFARPERAELMSITQPKLTRKPTSDSITTHFCSEDAFFFR